MLHVSIGQVVKKGSLSIKYAKECVVVGDTKTATTTDAEIEIKEPTKLLIALMFKSDLGLMENTINKNVCAKNLERFLAKNYQGGDENLLAWLGKSWNLLSHRFKHNSIKNSRKTYLNTTTSATRCTSCS